MFVPLVFETRLQQSDPGLVNLYAVARTQAIAKNEDGRRVVAFRMSGYQQNQQGKNYSHVGAIIRRK